VAQLNNCQEFWSELGVKFFVEMMSAEWQQVTASPIRVASVWIPFAAVLAELAASIQFTAINGQIQSQFCIEDIGRTV
jgi:hypothetical protein